MHRCDDGQSTRTAPITQLQAITAPAELAADQERAQEAALDVVHSAQSASECTYRQIMLGIHDHGELYLDFVIGTADQVSADELLAEIGADARHAQSVADRRDNADRAASRAARSHVGRTVARSEGIFFDTDVKLAEVLEPAAGLPTQDEALGFARIRGRACAVVQVGARWHVFALDEQLDYDDIWQTDAWQEHRTRLVPVGAAARLLVTRDGYVVRHRRGVRPRPRPIVRPRQHASPDFRRPGSRQAGYVRPAVGRNTIRSMPHRRCISSTTVIDIRSRRTSSSSGVAPRTRIWPSRTATSRASTRQ